MRSFCCGWKCDEHPPLFVHNDRTSLGMRRRFDEAPLYENNVMVRSCVYGGGLLLCSSNDNNNSNNNKKGRDPSRGNSM